MAPLPGPLNAQHPFMPESVHQHDLSTLHSSEPLVILVQSRGLRVIAFATYPAPVLRPPAALTLLEQHPDREALPSLRRRPSFSAQRHFPSIPALLGGEGLPMSASHEALAVRTGLTRPSFVATSSWVGISQLHDSARTVCWI